MIPDHVEEDKWNVETWSFALQRQTNKWCKVRVLDQYRTLLEHLANQMELYRGAYCYQNCQKLH